MRRRVAGGILPPGPRRPRRAPLDSPRSHRPAIRPQPTPPMGEQVRVPSRDGGQPPPGPGGAAPQPLVLPLSPTNQVVVERPERRVQRRAVEAPVVVDPPLHDDLNISARS